jgi:hypothetical protein
MVQKQIDDAAAREGISNNEAKARLLAEKRPSLDFARPEQIGAVAVFLCSSAADQVRGTSISVDGGGRRSDPVSLTRPGFVHMPLVEKPVPDWVPAPCASEIPRRSSNSDGIQMVCSRLRAAPPLRW